MYICTVKYNRIKSVLADQGKTSKWLAEQVTVSKVTVSRWASNSRQPSIEMLNKIAESLEVNICELLVQNEVKQPTS